VIFFAGSVFSCAAAVKLNAIMDKIRMRFILFQTLELDDGHSATVMLSLSERLTASNMHAMRNALRQRMVHDETGVCHAVVV
jgi:hypothetical protein